MAGATAAAQARVTSWKPLPAEAVDTDLDAKDADPIRDFNVTLAEVDQWCSDATLEERKRLWDMFTLVTRMMQRREERRGPAQHLDRRTLPQLVEDICSRVRSHFLAQGVVCPLWCDILD